MAETLVLVGGGFVLGMVAGAFLVQWKWERSKRRRHG